MRTLFRGYYPPTEEELEHIWTNGLIVLDTNALLNLFRYTQSTRSEFLAVLESFSESLWIPYQVGAEFHRNRLDVIHQQSKAFDEIESALASAKSDVSKALKKFERHPSLNAAGITETLEQHIGEIGDIISNARDQHGKAILEVGENERTFAAVTALYEGRVGEAFSTERLTATYEAGKQRYDDKIPPGYKDTASKPEPDRYGDLVLWEQILDQGRLSGKPAILVTDDAKEDWWYIVAGKTQGPRVELVDAYFEAAHERIHFYSPDRFLKYAQERKGSSVSDASLTEVEEVSSARSSARAVSVLRDRERQLEAERLHLRSQLDRLRERLESQRSDEPQVDLGVLHSEASQMQSRLGQLDAELEELDAYVNRTDRIEGDDDMRARWTSVRRERSHTRRQLDSIVQEIDRHRPAPHRPVAQTQIILRRADRVTNELTEVQRALQELGE